MRFKAGQEIVCVVHEWTYSGLIKVSSAVLKEISPKFNELVTVEGYKENGYILLCEYNHIGPSGTRVGYNEKNFEPLISDSEFEKALSEISIAEII